MKYRKNTEIEQKKLAEMLAERPKATRKWKLGQRPLGLPADTVESQALPEEKRRK